MKVQVRKTFHIWCEVEVDDGLSESDQKQQAAFRAAERPDNSGECEWAWTDFYAPAEEGFLEVAGVKYDDWYEV